MPQYKSSWNVTALYGNNTTRAKNEHEPAASTGLIVVTWEVAVLGMCASLNIVKSPAGSKRAGPRCQRA